MVRAFCRSHEYTFNEQSKMVTALTDRRHFRESHVTDGEPEKIKKSLQKIKID